MTDVISESRDLDSAQVTRLTAYFREEIFVIETADGRKWPASRDEYHQMVRELESDPARRLVSAPAGRHDVVYRVERVEEAEAEHGRGG